MRLDLTSPNMFVGTFLALVCCIPIPVSHIVVFLMVGVVLRLILFMGISGLQTLGWLNVNKTGFKQ